MRHVDRGRKLQAFGPCDDYGDPLPIGTDLTEMVYASIRGEHHILIDHDEAVRLRDELSASIEEIERNRYVEKHGRLPDAAAVRGILI